MKEQRDSFLCIIKKHKLDLCVKISRFDNTLNGTAIVTFERGNAPYW
jgi:hypothetical protein